MYIYIYIYTYTYIWGSISQAAMSEQSITWTMSVLRLSFLLQLHIGCGCTLPELRRKQGETSEGCCFKTWPGKIKLILDFITDVAYPRSHHCIYIYITYM